jgi:hypothetical protein
MEVLNLIDLARLPKGMILHELYNASDILLTSNDYKERVRERQKSSFSHLISLLDEYISAENIILDKYFKGNLIISCVGIMASLYQNYQNILSYIVGISSLAFVATNLYIFRCRTKSFNTLKVIREIVNYYKIQDDEETRQTIKI